MRSLLFTLLLLHGCGATCEPEEAVVPTQGFFVDISEVSGVQQGNVVDPAPEGMQSNDHPRLAFADLDGDGFDDIVAHSLLLNPMNGVPYTHVVLHNEGDGTFTDVSAASGLQDAQVAFFAFGDVDNDGDLDVFGGIDLRDWQDHTHGIWLNDGAGAFTRVVDAGVEAEPAFAAGAAFADVDGDAYLDLFLANGSTMAGVEDALFFGRGDGTFEKGTLRRAPAQPSNGVVACDVDNDGDQDFVVSTYGVSVLDGHNHLWINEGDRVFRERGLAWGMAAQITGNRWMEATGFGADPEPGVDVAQAIGSNGFGIDCGDVDGDGRMDIWLATISHPDPDYTRQWSDASQLLLNRGEVFEDVAEAWGVPFNEGDIDGGLADFDNDGRLDLSVTRERKYESRYEEEEQKGWFGLFRQTEGGVESVGLLSGVNDPEQPDLRIMKAGQNLAWSDIDHDGDVDLLVGGRDQGGGRANRLFRNDIGQDNPWLVVELEGDGSTINRDAYGARVSVWVGEASPMVREKKSGRGTYASRDGDALHFGLGGRACPERLEVRWPDGTRFEVDGDALRPRSRVRLTYPDVVEVAE